jgi:microcompartment protein CcmK/EutM
MKRGIVVGELWATRKAGGLEGSRLKLVAMRPAPAVASASGHDAQGDQGDTAALADTSLVVAVDTLDARDGQEVLVAFGSGARNVLLPGPHNRHLLCDAAVALIIDGDSDGDGDAGRVGS